MSNVLKMKHHFLLRVHTKHVAFSSEPQILGRWWMVLHTNSCRTKSCFKVRQLTLLRCVYDSSMNIRSLCDQCSRDKFDVWLEFQRVTQWQLIELQTDGKRITLLHLWYFQRKIRQTDVQRLFFLLWPVSNTCYIVLGQFWMNKICLVILCRLLRNFCIWHISDVTCTLRLNNSKCMLMLMKCRKQGLLYS